ncbi:hypothetical protein [Natronomonas sp. EA1]|uniref:hypothetical protein n=1 Tax=Natronomonas sp. EA1 TaxID=3421655 RepID=UPI003EC02C1C
MTFRRRALLALVSLPLCASTALAHGGSIAGAAGRGLAVPTWLFLATGGGVVGASFLLASFATDRAFLEYIHEVTVELRVPARDALGLGVRALGVVGLFATVTIGAVGPADPLRNLAVLLVWGGWWAGFAMTTYLFGNAWPLLNPWRTLARGLPTLDRAYTYGAWPSVVGLLALIWLEVVSPLADDPRLLALVVAVYTLGTLLGFVVFGDAWFERADPVSRVFRLYGMVAPLTWDDGLRLRLPGAGLTDDTLADESEVAFVVALLWVTTYDGLVATPPWADFARAAVGGVGIPAPVLYPAALLAGYGLFLGAYRLSARYGKRHARTYLDEATLSRRFAPSLLAIAAGYHLAHYLGYFLTLSPALAGALADPLSPAPAMVLVLPGWLPGLALAFVLLGHLLAVWVAHAVAYELFPSRLQAVRSQYALTLVMVLYTMTSLWIVSRPYAAPPYI